MKRKDWYEKITEETNQHKYQCKCGHKQIIIYNVEYTICDWCGRKIYKDKKRQFRDKMRQLLNNKN